MNKSVRSLALAGMLATSPLLAAPPPPAPPSGESEASANVEAQSRSQNSSDRRDSSSASLPDSREDDVALRGPLHEAFARPVSLDPVRFPVIDRQPPEPINEVPPEYRPDGDNVIWIPGYWSFEDSEEEFLWISGLWRDVPPGRRWVPGYWSEADGGYLWTPGEWIAADQRSITYLDEPPRSQERGPSSPAPSDDHFWIPGCWEYRQDGYVWRPGYWARHQQDWVWIPAHYDWTPNGYVYCNGYWDYDIDRRGIVYAPYRYRGRPVSNYTPRTALDVSHLLLHLFVNNRTRGYYFGDYYGRSSFRPWYNFHSSRDGYDPVFSYNSWRHGRDYQDRLVGWNQYFTRHQNFRPRTTLRAQQQFLSRNPNRQIADQVNIARAVTNAVGSELFGRRVIDVDRSERESLIQTAGALLSLADRRLNVESRGRARVSSENRGSARSEGRAGVRENSLELPEIFRPGSRNDRGPDGRNQNGRVDAPRTPDLPDRIRERLGNFNNGRPDRREGNDQSPRPNGRLPEIIRGGREGSDRNPQKGKDGVREIIRDGARALPGSERQKQSQVEEAVKPKAEVNPERKPKPQPSTDPVPRPKLPKTGNGGNGRGGNRGGKSNGKSGGLIPSVPGLK